MKNNPPNWAYQAFAAKCWEEYQVIESMRGKIQEINRKMGWTDAKETRPLRRKSNEDREE